MADGARGPGSLDAPAYTRSNEGRWRVGQTVLLKGGRYGTIVEIRPAEGGQEIFVEMPSGKRRGWRCVPDEWDPSRQWRKPPHERGLTVLADPDEPHWPVCHGCGEPWPCQGHWLREDARRQVHDLEQQIKVETETPHVCDRPHRNWQGKTCGRRFKTERGLIQHQRMVHGDDPGDTVPLFGGDHG